ncbi:amidohydrolase [Rhodococcus sp. 06-156-3C]|uniref:amidohydrolase family protein n=1 Tax=Nocardiaceae TaxID=85025 RepID=UPI000689DF3A|nr:MULTISPECIES: amidohydrolase family protein [Rhodococcus]OZD18194.1 amidohydrolase [Rhodococcus sp. 06-156-4C]OZD18791.1 amidohydrolase [Rhodococcus sp. 06-156-3C]OZD22301.1 amidohydrolase [Rhodococcus sp. 06-156-4a]OZD34107.1 amidohydrolase [Rhodococcus sp. 06-156-3b]OZD38844.1 amidohydrolase [Rhodococcus sp. 06-156-3]
MTATEPAASPGYRRIATEEAYAPTELFDLYRRMLDSGTCKDRGFVSLMGFYLNSASPKPVAVRRRLQSLGDERLADMDATGIDHQILSLTSPGTNVFDAATAREIAILTNDRLAQACRDYPDRFSALAALPMQDPAAAVRELDRAVNDLGLRGIIANSHIGGSYLDDPMYRPIFEAAESLGVPIYLHPNTPNNEMIGPLHEAGIDGAIFGFGVETGMHLLRIITSGLFDRYPNLKLVVGHLGEALPYWLARIDYMHAAQVAAGRYDAIRPLERKPSEYFRHNIWLTTSGMPWQPAILFAREVVGADRVMYAMDYPYQFVPDEVKTQDALPISQSEKRAFFESIAVDVFGLNIPAAVNAPSASHQGVDHVHH